MLWAAWIEYTPDQAKVAEARPAHRQYEAKLLAEGKLALGGPLTDNFGALIVYEAESKEAAEELLEADPFHRSGVFVRWQIRPWKVVFASTSLVQTPG